MRPRPPQSQGLRAANHARDKDVEQVRRLLSAQKPAPKAPPAGGVVGQAEVVSTGGVVFNAGTNEMSYGGVTYGSPTDPNEGSDGASSVPVSSWLTVSGYQLFVTPGWYIPVLYMKVLWDDIATAPASFSGPYMYGGYDAAHNLFSTHAPVPFSTDGKGGFQQIGNYGPTYIHEGSDFHAELRASGGNPTAANNSGPFQSVIAWNITKLT